MKTSVCLLMTCVLIFFAAGCSTTPKTSKTKALYVDGSPGELLLVPMPSEPNQAANKAYVDSVSAKNKTGTAFVDPVYGDDLSGQIQSGNNPFKSIQAAVNACSAYASSENRFVVAVNIGVYNEPIIHMKNFISVRGSDIESTIINGQLSWDSNYNDISGAEIQLLSVYSSNAPCLNIDCGADQAYVGVRSCALYANYDRSFPVMDVVRFSRGNVELYATTWVELDLYPTDATSGKNMATLYYGTTDSMNVGKYEVNSYDSSHMVRCTDANDTICEIHSDATVSSYFASKNDETLMYMDNMSLNTNKVKLICQVGSKAQSVVQDGICQLFLSSDNTCDVFFAEVINTPAPSSGRAYVLGTRLICPNIVDGHSWIGSSPTVNDYVEVFNSQIAAGTDVYPKVYKTAGSAGHLGYFMQHGDGDLLTGGNITLDTANDIDRPDAGHVTIYAGTNGTSSAVQPCFIDPAGAAYGLSPQNSFLPSVDISSYASTNVAPYFKTNVYKITQSMGRSLHTVVKTNSVFLVDLTTFATNGDSTFVLNINPWTNAVSFDPVNHSMVTNGMAWSTSKWIRIQFDKSYGWTNFLGSGTASP